jgi:DNA-binding MarR family transcriptional regulator
MTELTTGTWEGEPKTNDPLDWAHFFWQRDFEGPAEAFLAMTGLLRVSQVISSSLDEVLKPYDLNRTTYLFLMTLRLSSEGHRKLSSVSEYLLVHPTTVTLAADQLESRKLVARVPHPTDRRTTLCELTPTGRLLVEKATSDLKEFNFGLGRTSRSEARTLLRLVQQVYSTAFDKLGKRNARIRTALQKGTNRRA